VERGGGTGVAAPSEWFGDIVAGQAGWYHAPGEEGLLRYWNGAVWTEHRQPVPVPEPMSEPDPAPAPAQPAEPDWSMDQFERQFDSVNQSVWIAPVPQLAASRFAPQQTVAAAAVKFAPSAPAAPAEEVQDPAPVASQPAGPRPDRMGVLRAFAGVVTGLALILIGAGLIVVLGLLSPAGTGQAQTMGIVTSLGSASGACSPIAHFAGAGGSFSTTTPAAMSPCPFGLGQTVEVVYSTANPSSSGRILVPGLLQQYAWAIPVLGVVVFLVSIVIFLIRAGSVGAGMAVIRGDGSRRRRRAVDSQPQGR
jgi:hypothetical protein